ncbi:HPr family phosphocarrier protein [Paenibacillus sp. MSJ-34]|uniref:HPr family phosphocarrier protein n=1 Tax=Paenibacillus sp. MSJ-34 TaxID=2841529 RepID=UPI001C0FDA53|nr:HPr family phosphocarrier protein [Paenibacillus sp. MSJ-34]MBU5444638.1 HPr family phosphocarrier protein [Paenibacillus sp. MSJ-34]
MLETIYRIHFEQGLHLRPSHLIATEAGKFQSDIRVEYDGKFADGKSVLSLLKLGAPYGGGITISVNGTDEREALLAILQLLSHI